jgi:hypothetical protein
MGIQLTDFDPRNHLLRLGVGSDGHETVLVEHRGLLNCWPVRCLSRVFHHDAYNIAKIVDVLNQQHISASSALYGKLLGRAQQKWWLLSSRKNRFLETIKRISQKILPPPTDVHLSREAEGSRPDFTPPSAPVPEEPPCPTIPFLSWTSRDVQKNNTRYVLTPEVRAKLAGLIKQLERLPIAFMQTRCATFKVEATDYYVIYQGTKSAFEIARDDRVRSIEGAFLFVKIYKDSLFADCSPSPSWHYNGGDVDSLLRAASDAADLTNR